MRGWAEAPKQASFQQDTGASSSASAAEPVADLLIATARRELALQGARALSLRRLAVAGGVTLATLSYHLGSKARILRTLVEAERELDRERHRAWFDRFAGVERFEPATLAALIELYLDESVGDEASGGGRLTSLIWADLVLRAGVDPETAALLHPWLEERRDFWRRLLADRIEEAGTWADAVIGYVTDEGVHALAIGERSDYRLLRRMTIERLSQRLDPAAHGSLGRIETFEILVRRLDPALDLPRPDSGSELLKPGRRRDIAFAACEVILEEGAEALTHRAVGERAGVPASTVAYHFRSGHDLLRAGQEMVYLVAQNRAPAPGEDSAERRGLVTIRGTLSISLAAARDPSLAPQAVDLRRLRGENLAQILKDQGHHRIDRLDAQTIAVAAIGAGALGAAHAAFGITPGDLVDWLIL